MRARPACGTLAPWKTTAVAHTSPPRHPSDRGQRRGVVVRRRRVLVGRPNDRVHASTTVSSPCGSSPAPTTWCSARTRWPEPSRRPTASSPSTEPQAKARDEGRCHRRTGLIGSRLVEELRRDGHEPLAASPDSGVNALTGEGLAEALEGAQVVVDVSNPPAGDDAAPSWTTGPSSLAMTHADGPAYPRGRRVARSGLTTTANQKELQMSVMSTYAPGRARPGLGKAEVRSGHARSSSASERPPSASGSCRSCR
jgi:hypothetical protein